MRDFTHTPEFFISSQECGQICTPALNLLALINEAPAIITGSGCPSSQPRLDEQLFTTTTTLTATTGEQTSTLLMVDEPSATQSDRSPPATAPTPQGAHSGTTDNSLPRTTPPPLPPVVLEVAPEPVPANVSNHPNAPVVLESLLQHARAFGMFRRLGLPEAAVRLWITEQGNYFTTADAVILINRNNRNPFEVLRHELQHLARSVELTAIYLADRNAYEARVLEAVLVRVGTGTPRLHYDRERQMDVVNNRANLSPAGRALMREALREFIATDQSLREILSAERFRPLINEAAFNGSIENAVRELQLENSHYNLVRRTYVIDMAAIDPAHGGRNPALTEVIENRAAHYRGIRLREGSLYDEPQLIRLTRGISADATGLQHSRTYNRESRDEISARRAEAAWALTVIAEAVEAAGYSTPEERREAIRRLGRRFLQAIQRENRREQWLNEYEAQLPTRPRQQSIFERARQGLRYLFGGRQAIESPQSTQPSAAEREHRPPFELSNQPPADAPAMNERRFMELVQTQLRELYPDVRASDLTGRQIDGAMRLVLSDLEGSVGDANILGRTLSAAEVQQSAATGRQILELFARALTAVPSDLQARQTIESVRHHLTASQTNNAPVRPPSASTAHPLPSSQELSALGAGRVITEASENGVRFRMEGAEWSRDNVPCLEEIRMVIEREIARLEERIRECERSHQPLSAQDRALLETYRRTRQALVSTTNEHRRQLELNVRGAFGGTRAAVGSALGIAIVASAALAWFIRIHNNGQRPPGLGSLPIPGC